jgi:hypothetical protein
MTPIAPRPPPSSWFAPATTCGFRRRYSHPVDKSSGLRSDQTIVFTGDASAHDYPAPARRVHF